MGSLFLWGRLWGAPEVKKANIELHAGSWQKTEADSHVLRTSRQFLGGEKNTVQDPVRRTGLSRRLQHLAAGFSQPESSQLAVLSLVFLINAAP
jgi:hypothetical protein